jgi:hypothetical protein
LQLLERHTGDAALEFGQCGWTHPNESSLLTKALTAHFPHFAQPHPDAKRYVWLHKFFTLPEIT